MFFSKINSLGQILERFVGKFVEWKKKHEATSAEFCWIL